MKVIVQNLNTLVNFTVVEFDVSCELVMPIIAFHAWSTTEVHKLLGRLVMFCPQQHFFNSLLYMKHDNITISDAFGPVCT